MPQRLRAKGQALVEFALTATLIFFLLAATVDLGLIFFTLQGLHNAAQEGATFGSRWLKVDPATGASNLDYAAIRNHVRFEAGNRGAGFANLLDLNNNGLDDFGEDGANIGVATGNTLFPTYIQVAALEDRDGDGNPLNDNTPCPTVADKTLPCFLHVEVSAEYKFQFPLAPAFMNQRRLTSSYVIPMRSGLAQSGAPTTSPVISTVTATPTNTPAPTSTTGPTPTRTATPRPASPTATQCPALGAPSLNGSRSGSNVNLSWGAVSGATSYRVYRSTSATGSFALLTTVTGTSAADTINRGNTYQYYVVAVNSCGQPGTQSTTVSISRP